MDLQIVQDFIARGVITKDDINVPAMIVGKYLTYGPGYVQCRVVIENRDWQPEFGDLLYHSTPVQLRGKTEGGSDVWSPEFRPSRLARGFIHKPSQEDQILIEGVASFFIEGDLHNFDASKGNSVCIISITPTPLATDRDGYYIKSWDGTVTRRGKKRKGIRWNTKLGPAELIENYEYLDENIGFDKALVQIQKCQITIKIKSRRRVASLQSMLTDLETTLEEPLLLVSFLSRRSITWYEAKANFMPKNYSAEDDLNAIVRRGQNQIYESSVDNSLFAIPIVPEILKEGLFQLLLDNYEASVLKSTIRQTIQYLLTSYEMRYFEARLGLIYAALESLVHGLSVHHGMAYLMGSSKFDKLSKKLKEVIQREIAEENIAKGVIDKLAELRRPPIQERLLKLLEIYKLNNLRHSSDMPTALQGILQRRNNYIHQGAVDSEKHPDDLYFLQELIELWLLTLLNCPTSSLNRSAFRKFVVAV